MAISEFALKASNRTLAAYSIGDIYHINMGPANFTATWMPQAVELRQIAGLYELNERELICVDMGNPHLVIINNNLSLADKKTIGSALEHHSYFPQGVNVNFVEIIAKNINLKVWERGVSEFTNACGSGACASFAASHKLGFVDHKAQVNFKRGALTINIQDNDIIMAGPAELVFEGVYYYE